MVSNLLTRLTDLKWEIVVSDNHSPDGTRGVCAELSVAHPAIRLIRPPQHLPTAEENLRFALSQSRGRYVWVLGDDDDPIEAGVLEMLAYVKGDRHDCVIFNSRAHSFEGYVQKWMRTACSTPEWNGSIVEFARRTGFWFVLAGFSTLLLKRPQDKLKQFDEYLAISKIYSHVAWIIDSYSSGRFTFCATPIVAYRQNQTDVVLTGHWPAVAKREATFAKGIWTNAFLRLCDRLVERGIIDRHYMSTVVDRNHEYRYIMAYAMLDHFIGQLRAHNIEKDPYFTAAEFSYFAEWGRHLFPQSANIVHLIFAARDGFESNAGYTPPGLIDALTAILRDRSSYPWQRHFYVKTLGSYDLYKFGPQCWAVRRDVEARVGVICEQLQIDPVGFAVLTAPDYPTLVQRVRDALDKVGRLGSDEALSAWDGEPLGSAPFDTPLSGPGPLVLDGGQSQAAQVSVATLTAEIEMYRNSRTIRYTAPLRQLATVVRKTLGRA